MNKRNTVQKHLVLNAVAQLHNHPTAEMVYDHVVKQYPNISKATVYRILNQAAATGELKNIGSVHGSARFDHTMCAHEHFVCNTCNCVIDIPPINITDKIKKLGGLFVTKINITLHGNCKACN